MPGAGKPFTKGNRASKGKGRPPVPPELKAARKLSRPQVELVLARYMGSNSEALEKALTDEATPMLERMVIAIIRRACIEGDQAALGWLLDQTIGKVKEAPKDHNFNFNFSNLTRDQQLEMGREAIKFLEDGKQPVEVEG